MTAILLLIIGAGILAYVFYPVFAGYSAYPVSIPEEDALDNLQIKKNQIYETILELDFEYEMGRINEEDYRRVRNDNKLNAAKVLGEIDRMQSVSKNHDAWIEHAVKLSNKDKEGAIKTCPKCETANAANGRFCIQCGYHFK